VGAGIHTRGGRGLNPSLCFVVPAHGRLELAAICLRQLRRTCDALVEHGISATAVVVGDDGNLETAESLDFGAVRRDNEFLSAKFNDGIQAALDPQLENPPMGGGEYEVIDWRRFRGHEQGSRFTAKLTPAAEGRAIERGNIRLISRDPITFDAATYIPPRGWVDRPADYVIPCGSDDWIDHRILTDLPPPDTIVGFQSISFVREDGAEIMSRFLDYLGGAGIRIYPRQLMEPLGYRPADEDRERACDTSIFVNLRRHHGDAMRVEHRHLHDRQIVDWKSRGQQLNSFDEITARHRRGTNMPDPFSALAGVFPDEALREMKAYYVNQQEEVQ
jgi:hypothetical protein